MSDIVNLKPEAVWRFFDEITRIPRPSKKEEKIVAYLIDFAKSRSLEYRKDSTGNVVIRKGASPGMENRPVVVLQSHVSLSTLGMKAVPSWWICWKKWLLVPKNSPVVCKRAKV